MLCPIANRFPESSCGSSTYEATYDTPGVGRFGVMADPTGAMLAIIKPLPTQTQP